MLTTNAFIKFPKDYGHHEFTQVSESLLQFTDLHGLMVSTLGFESSNLSSALSGTWFPVECPTMSKKLLTTNSGLNC